MIFKLGLQHRGLEVYKVYINDYPGDDLDIVYGKVKFGRLCNAQNHYFQTSYSLKPLGQSQPDFT